MHDTERCCARAGALFMCVTMSIAVRTQSRGRDSHSHDYEHYHVHDTERYLHVLGAGDVPPPTRLPLRVVGACFPRLWEETSSSFHAGGWKPSVRSASAASAAARTLGACWPAGERNCQVAGTQSWIMGRVEDAQ